MTTGDPLIYSLEDLKKELNIDHIDVALIKSACKMLQIPFNGAGNIFFNPATKKPNESHLDFVHRQLICTFGKESKNTIILYEPLNKPHTVLLYYRAISFRGSEFLDVKKVLRVHKLKAFL